MSRQPIAFVASFLALGISQAKSEVIEFSCFSYSTFRIDGDKLFRNGQLQSKAANIIVTPNYLSWQERNDALGLRNEFRLDRDTGTMIVDEYFRGQSTPSRSASYTCTKAGAKTFGKI